MTSVEHDNDSAAPLGSRCRLALGVSYLGSAFHGFAIQPNQRTVAGELMAALARITGESMTYTCAGRTDRGVHAHAQVVHVDLSRELLARRYDAVELHVGDELPAIARNLSRQLGPDVVVWRAVVVEPSFDARHDAIERRYRYDLLVSEYADPLRAASAWWVGPGLNLAAMQKSGTVLLGSHDFSGFCRRPPGHEGPLTRRVHTADWQVIDESCWRFEIAASSFCHQMVRSIVGSMVSIGAGKTDEADLLAQLVSGDRRGAPTLAPPQGLCLIAVTYPQAKGGRWG